MKRVFQLFIISILFSGCSVFKKTSNSDITVKFRELNYGITVATEQFTKVDNESPSGIHSFSSDYVLLEKTDTIKAEIGNRFGVYYILESNVDEWIPIRQVWIYPEKVIDENGNSFKKLDYIIEKPTNDDRWSAYKFEKECELVKGEWTFQVFYGKKKLYERKFYIK